MGTCACIWMSSFVVQQKLTQYCEAIILQDLFFKKKEKRKKKIESERDRKGEREKETERNRKEGREGGKKEQRMHLSLNCLTQ